MIRRLRRGQGIEIDEVGAGAVDEDLLFVEIPMGQDPACVITAIQALRHPRERGGKAWRALREHPGDQIHPALEQGELVFSGVRPGDRDVASVQPGERPAGSADSIGYLLPR